MTRVLIIDDHPIVRQGCRRVLQDIGVDDLVEASTVVSGYRAFLRGRPDLVVTDLTFEGDDLAGIPLVQRMSQARSDIPILVFSMHDDPAIVSRVLTSGAHGYVLKDSPSGELATAYKTVRDGERYLSHELAIRVAILRARDERLSADGLTEREQQVLGLLGRGDSYDTIAAKLGISYKTVNNVTSLVRAKLGLSSVAELLRFAMQNGRSRPF